MLMLLYPKGRLSQASIILLPVRGGLSQARIILPVHRGATPSQGPFQASIILPDWGVKLEEERKTLGGAMLEPTRSEGFHA